MLTLIQTSQNRRDELKRFVASLNAQTNINFADIQLIFVDQGDNFDIYSDLNNSIEFKYVKTDRCSLSKARNIGLNYAKGDFIGFPDDDCWYEPDTLSKVLGILMKSQYDGISGKGTDEKGELTSKFPDVSANITPTRRCAAISYTLFCKFEHRVKFDENMGVGSPYNIGAGEETDYLLNLIENFNYTFLYSPEVIVHHPTNKIYDWPTLYRRTYSYARGDGYLSQKHNFPILYLFKQFSRPLFGILVYALQLQFKRSKKSWLNLKGRIEGFLWKN